MDNPVPDNNDRSHRSRYADAELQLALAVARDIDQQRRQKKIRRRRVAIVAALGVFIWRQQMKKARKRYWRQQLLRAGMYSKKMCTYRASIQPPASSPWAYFLASQEHREEVWMDWVGMPENIFKELVRDCHPYWRTNAIIDEHGTPQERHLQKRQLDCEANIALVLHFMNKRMEYSEVGKKFGLVDSIFSRYLSFGIRILLPVLQLREEARIFWPCTDTIYLDQCVDLISLYEPRLRDMYGYKPTLWIDGVRFIIANKWSRKEERKADQSGEKKATLRKMILGFDPFGKVRMAIWNLQGSNNESRPCSDFGLYSLINEELPDGYCILTDTAYMGKLKDSKVVRILKTGEYLPRGMTVEEMKEREELITRGRQPSEWGNNQLIQAMVRLRVKLSTDDKYNGTLMELALHLYNIRVHYTDRNEVKHFFLNLEAFHEDPLLKQELGIDFG